MSGQCQTWVHWLPLFTELQRRKGHVDSMPCGRSTASSKKLTWQTVPCRRLAHGASQPRDPEHIYLWRVKVLDKLFWALLVTRKTVQVSEVLQKRWLPRRETSALHMQAHLALCIKSTPL